MLQRAVFSSDRRYRYVLRRPLTESVALGASSKCVFIMLNPSTADEERNDPTITRCIGFASSWGFDLLEVVNLFGLRSTAPRGLRRVADPVGPENDLYLLQAVTGADLVVVAWGNAGSYLRRDREVINRLSRRGLRLQCLAVNGGGQPRHPLYSRADDVPVPFG